MNYKNYQKQKGFTLTELMVVIAIIGILSAIIYTSVQAARDKGANASAKIAMANTIVQAKLFYFANGESFSGVCTSYPISQGLVKVSSIKDILLSAARATKIATDINPGAGGWNRATCHDSSTTWAADVPLRGVAREMYCVDSTGLQIVTTKNLILGSYSCSK